VFTGFWQLDKQQSYLQCHCPQRLPSLAIYISYATVDPAHFRRNSSTASANAATNQYSPHAPARSGEDGKRKNHRQCNILEQPQNSRIFYIKQPNWSSRDNEIQVHIVRKKQEVYKILHVVFEKSLITCKILFSRANAYSSLSKYGIYWPCKHGLLVVKSLLSAICHMCWTCSNWPVFLFSELQFFVEKIHNRWKLL